MRSSLALVIALWCGITAAFPEEVDTEYGRIRGKDDGAVIAFYGIPFAKPPVKDLRWRPPQKAAPWENVRDCSFQNDFLICPQFDIDKKIHIGQEDCLYMNIYVPSDVKEGELLPVMFWIYGGGYTIGDGFEFGFYNGYHMAKERRVVVVEHNYRLGALGFLATPALASENPNGTVGGYALQDQTLALQFAYNNILNFAGNRSKMAIFGESAGAFSVCWHLVSPASRVRLGLDRKGGSCCYSIVCSRLYMYTSALGMGCS